MNIAFVVHDYDVREGHGRYAVELVTRLARSADVTLYAANIRDDPPAGVTVTKVPAVRRPSYATILTFPRAFRSVCRHHDLIHAQGWSASSAHVVTAHIVLAAWRAATRHAGMRRGAGERLLGGWVQRREAALYRNDVRLVIAPSERVKTDLAKYYQRNGAVEVVPHAFEPTSRQLDKAEARNTFDISRDVFLALYAGDARKGLDVALESVAMNKGMDLLVVSRSPSAPYLAHARELGIRDRVHWAGSLPDVAPAHSAADVLLHPTIYDAFGLVVAEAMAYGVPPIVSNAAGIAELIEHRVSGWIVPPNDPKACAEALRTLREDATLRETIGRRARQTASTRDWDKVTEETVSCYDQVLNG